MVAGPDGLVDVGQGASVEGSVGRAEHALRWTAPEAPVYLEHRAVVSVMETIVDQYDPSNDSTARIKQKLEAAWSVNAIDQVDSGSVRIERRRSGLKLILQYEVRFPIVGDIVGVWAFDETFAAP